MEAIYLDNNATTPMLPAVWEVMRPYLTEVYGNPASAHGVGARARRALEDARERVAELLGAWADEVVFTSGATEANNLALFGLAGDPPGHIVVSPVEHPSVVEPIGRLEQQGFAVERLPVDASGLVPADALAGRLRPETRLVAVMRANHETGALQPVAELAAQLDGRAHFHCDAVQAVGRVPVHFHELGVTTLAASAHKFHGPKGVGVLLVRRGVELRPHVWGGHQQQGRRPGTEPVALAVGLATALELAVRDAAGRTEQVLRLRHRFLSHLRDAAAPVVVNGPADSASEPLLSSLFPLPSLLVPCPSPGVPHTLNVSFPGCRADVLLMNLDLAGVACSTGSACSSGSLLPSPVLRAMGVSDEVLHSAMRFSFSPLLTEDEVAEAARRVVGIVTRLRALRDE
jgi:cysteine desulfurase